jgi:ribulose-phosphate 3-epimerase
MPLDTHLMVSEPDRMLRAFAEAGSDHLTFHIEAAVHAHRLVQNIVELGKKPGVSLVPSTPVSAIAELLPDLFQVLVMTVNPGFGGQEMIPSCVEKVRQLDAIRRERKLSFHIAVDGGINEKTASTVRDAGADVLISGSAFFKSKEPAAMLSMLRGVAVA